MVGVFLRNLTHHNAAKHHLNATLSHLIIPFSFIKITHLPNSLNARSIHVTACVDQWSRRGIPHEHSTNTCLPAWRVNQPLRDNMGSQLPCPCQHRPFKGTLPVSSLLSSGNSGKTGRNSGNLLFTPFSTLSTVMEGIKHRNISVNGINMHIAEKGEGPLILFIHGFPELWYSWRHQIVALSELGYRAVAPDLRGYGDTDAPASPSSYTSLHVVGDLIALLDAIAADQEKVFVVGHDWGAIMAWNLCLYRPDRVKALVNLSVVFTPRNPKKKPLETLRAVYGDDYYICRIQEAGEVEAEFAQIGTAKVLQNFLTYRNPGPLYLPKGKGFGDSLDTPIILPSWLTEDDINYYTSKYEKKGFTGGLNYYRALDLNWELTGPWTGTQIKVPAKFIVGDLDLTYNGPGTKEYIHNGGLKKYVPFLQEVVVMEGVAHFIHEEEPGEVNKHIYDFIQKF